MSIGQSIINLQNLHDVPVNDVISQKFFGKKSLEPLSLDDIYILARAAYEAEDFNLAVDWLQRVTSDYTNVTDVEFSLTNVLNLLSSTYFKVGNKF